MTDFLLVDPSVACETETYFRSSLLSLRERSENRKYVCVSQANPSVALNIHLCYAGCHARYIRNTFLCAPTTTSLLITIYHNYIFSCFFFCLFVLQLSLLAGFYFRHAFALHCRIFFFLGGGVLSPHLLLFLMVRPVGARGLCNCVTAFRVSSSAVG